MNIPSTIKIIAFDADDTLWMNETYYRDTEKAFAYLLKDYLSEEKVNEILLKTESENLEHYGYGVKGFMLSMLETALKVSGDTIDKEIISQILDLGKKLIFPPMNLLDGVKETLEALNKRGAKLVLATKGDLLDQGRKLKNSGLEKCFHHIEIMSNKNPEDYQKLLNRLEILPEEFLMIGNSVKSDILPVLELGAYAIHVPYHTIWALENVTNNAENHEHFLKIKAFSELLQVI